MDTPESKHGEKHICDTDISNASVYPYTKSLRAKGPEIRRLRKKLGLKQADIAFESDTTQGRISDAENERCETQTATLLKLAKFFGVELDKIAYVAVDNDRSDSKIRSGVADVLRFLFSFDESESIGETFEEFKNIVASAQKTTHLQSFHRLDSEDRLAVWSKLEQEGWSRIFIDTPNMERQLQSWCNAPALMADIIRYAHIDNTFQMTAQMVDAVSDTVGDIVEYHSGLEPQQLPISQALKPIAELLGERVEFLLSQKVEKLEDIDAFADALLSCDLSLTGQNRGVSRVLCEVYPSVTALLRFLYLRDNGDIENFELMRQLLVNIQQDQFWVYSQLASGNSFPWSIDMWCRSRQKMITLMSHTIVLKGAVNHRMLGFTTPTAFRTDWFPNYVSEEFTSFALKVWGLMES